MTKKIQVLLEMRPTLEGFAGIPQENRLLFRGLRMLENLEVEGMIQTSHRVLSKGTSKKRSFFVKEMSQTKKINRYSRVIISIAEKPFRTMFDKAADWARKKFSLGQLTFDTMFGLHPIKLTEFESIYFKDFIWRTFFSKTLPATDFELVTSANHKVCSVPWHTLHQVGLATLSFKTIPKYPSIDTNGIDVFISQTPYPARISKKTKLVVRYHDAIPVMMPHTISDKSIHQATHFYSLMMNVKNGGYFACVSEATRKDLITLFPEAEERAVTIHNMVSHHYHNEDSSYDLVPGIIRARLYSDFENETKDYGLVPKFFTVREKENFYRNKLYSKKFNYLLVVSTIEPRKNHSRLLAAWEVLKAETDSDLKLIIVGTLGWDYLQILKNMSAWIDRGDLFMLNAVPAPDLRVLYRHAVATVCPSIGEGFDFSGVEAMRSGGVVVASDIPVHREVYDSAAQYFDPYSTTSLVKALKEVVYDSAAQEVQDHLRLRGQEVSERYLPQNILPKWQEFLGKLTNK